MEKILEKMDSYNILNNLFPGVVLDYLFEKMLNIDLVQGSIIENLFLYYFLGMLISRVGSLIIEPLCRKIRWVKYADYGEYIKACNIDKKVDTLSEVNNSYRTIFSGFIITIFAKIYLIITEKINTSFEFNKFMILLVLTVLFAFTYKKQTKYVADRVKKVNATEKNN